MKRRDGPALRDTAVWVLPHILLAAGGIHFWGSWLAVPFWLAYGVLYRSACDSRWHECGHGTAFRTRWMNDVVYHIASFQIDAAGTLVPAQASLKPLFDPSMERIKR